jgi:hypothetical protein
MSRMRWFGVPGLIAVLSIACVTGSLRERGLSQRLDAMSRDSKPDWDAVREVLLDCKDREYELGSGIRDRVFLIMDANAPPDIVRLVRDVAQMSINEADPLKATSDALAISSALAWLARNRDPDVGKIAVARLSERNGFVISAAFRALTADRHWAATEQVLQAMRDVPKDATALVPNAAGLAFLAKSPETDERVCEVQSSLEPLREYCAGRIGTSKPFVCEGFESSWMAVRTRFGCPAQR